MKRRVRRHASNHAETALTVAGHVITITEPEKILYPAAKATAVAQLPQGDDWIYEVKWDGYRALALKEGKSVRLMSLKEKNLTSDFPSVAAEVQGLRDDKEPRAVVREVLEGER